MASFDRAFDIVVIGLEGGELVSDDPLDPGGLTKFGISLAAYPSLGREGILALTQAKAKTIFKKDYWLAIQTQAFPEFSRLAVFDTAVNHGVAGASKIIQRALNSMGSALVVDGEIGPKTLAAAEKADAARFIVAILEERQRLYRSLETYARFGKGWERRILTVGVES